MQEPQVLIWFKVYSGFMVLFCLVFAGLGLFLLANPDAFVDPNAGVTSSAPSSSGEAAVMGFIYAVLGVVFAIAFVIGLLTPRKFWGWVYNLVLICIGLTSCCLWPATIPLLIFWIKEPVRLWYKNEPNHAYRASSAGY